MSDLYQRQMDLEESYSTESIIASQKQVLDAFAQGRGSDIGAGRALIARAFEASIEPYKERIGRRTSGVGGKYLALLRGIDPELAVMIGLRTVLNACADHESMNMQKFLTTLGRSLETESLLDSVTKVNSAYASRTIQYLDSAGTRSVSHRYRTLISGANTLGLDWQVWSVQERTGVSKILTEVLYEHTGLFKWFRANDTDTYKIVPTDTLSKYLTDAIESSQSTIKVPPMLVKPLDWTGQFDGGYLTEWCRAYSPMCGIRTHERTQRKWVIEGLSSDAAIPLRQAMNKAQSTPYRVNQSVLEVLRKATAMRVGILGLPSSVSKPKPVFTLGEDWDKVNASTAELDEFKLWKASMAIWYTEEAKRVGRKSSILSKIRELARFKDEDALYFPTFIDWRGRLYFRSTLQPQQSDAVKGCLDFAEGKRLGSVGLHWLKVHVANSCGYDKHDDKIKAKWTEDNWDMIQHFLNNPYDIDAPEPDTAFTLIQAAYALQDALALDNPEDYICHVPVAMDATCSGLQHLSALTRDTTGGAYTNLIDNGSDQKSDIYKRVGSIADETKGTHTKDVVIQDYWKDREVTRQMSKKPVMTHVYGSTLISTMDSIMLDMSSAGMPVVTGDDGRTLYSLHALSVPIAKALRQGVVETVPKCSEMMNYLQKINRRSKEKHLQWVTKVGMPVVNWAEGVVLKKVVIKSMGVHMILMSYGDGKYNVRSATNGIVPNFVHSNDSAHLCMTLNEFKGSIVPIHDSFGTHPSDVPELHKALRSTFIELYDTFKIEDFLEFNGIEQGDLEVPTLGDLDLEVIRESRFMFC